MTDEAGVAVGGRTWRLPFGWRTFFIAGQAFIPLTVVVFTFVPDDVAPGSAVPEGILAAAILAWLVLARRAWLESVTLTADALVIRNVLTTRRIPLTNIAGVTIGRNCLQVTESSALAPSGEASGSHAAGRQADGRSRNVGAVRINGAYWTGRRTEADVIAEAIAAAAGLPPLAPRKKVIGRGTARFLLVAGMACLAVGFLFGPLQGAGTGLPHDVNWVAVVLWPLGAVITGHAIWANVDYMRTPHQSAPDNPRASDV